MFRIFVLDDFDPVCYGFLCCGSLQFEFLFPSLSSLFQDSVIRELLFSSALQTSSLQLTALHWDADGKLFLERPQVH